MEEWIKLEERPPGLLLAYSVRPAMDGWHYTELRDQEGNVFWKKYKTVRYARGESEEWYHEPGLPPSSSISSAK